MLIKTGGVIPYSEITPETVVLDRRRFLKRAGLGAVGGSLIPRWASASPLRHAADDELTPYETVVGYNNFYEFGTGKADPAKNAKNFHSQPWTVEIKGEIEEEKTWDLEDLIRDLTIEERVYRHRCVEGWSMVVPWNGFPLRDLIAKLKPTSRAKFVEFTTLKDSRRMPGQKSGVLDWPYVEALRLDEAMHPLTMMVTGLYGKTLLPQNGAPWRLIVPWKYGFKGGKSIVRIRFAEKQPRTTWSEAIPREYGFFANVNPEVSHPRWSQAKERRLGDFFKRDTLMFNGYADEVQSLYSGMDLRKYF